MTHPLDNPVFSSLTGAHARFAERRGNILRYPVDVCPFVALPDEPDEADWADAADLVGPGAMLALAGVRVPPPDGWEVTMIGDGVQMTGDDLQVAADPEAVPLGLADVPEMLDLTARAKPGPFLRRTFELGTYLGIRRHGMLVAMAGERLHPEGWTEISAVCTDEAWRGQGLAGRLIRAVGAGIRARGEVPFLHALATNPAIALYEELGFRVRKGTVFAAARIPEMPDVLIRLADPGEYEAIGELSEAAYSHDYAISDSYRRGLRDVAARAAEHEVWVAVDRPTGQLLGTAVTPRPGGHVSELGRPGELDFRLLAVAPSARRRGIGRLLVEHIIALAAERGATRVVLNSGPQMTGAHQLYDAMGFTRLTERETRIVDGHTQPLLAFGYEVGDGRGL